MYRNKDLEAKALEAADFVGGRLSIAAGEIKTAVVLGTGWAEAIQIEDSRQIDLENILGFESLSNGSLTAIAGHDRMLICGHVGQSDNRVLFLKGRIHVNESPSEPQLVMPLVRLQIEMLFQMGVRNLILTCAAGTIVWPIEVGDVVVIRDFVTSAGLILPLWAGEFCTPEDALDQRMANEARSTSVPGLRIKYGTYAMQRGPHFEGRARDKENFRRDGAHVVGMSIVPECATSALYKDDGVKVAALAYITNDWLEEHSHDANRDRAKASSLKLGDFLSEYVDSVSKF
ncbi:MAG: hypothetical protein ABIH21_05175 [Patescibacteria group bacterium]